MSTRQLEKAERFLRQTGNTELADAVYEARNKIVGLKLHAADLEQCCAALRERLDKYEPRKAYQPPRTNRAPAESDG